MLMILDGEFLPTFCKIVKIVLIVMELFLWLPNDHVAAWSIWEKPLSFTTC